MAYYCMLLLFSLYLCGIEGFYVSTPQRWTGRSKMSMQTAMAEADVKAFLSKSHLSVTFDGFGEQNVTCVVALGEDMKSEFSSGIESTKKGLWKVYKEDPTDDLWTLELQHFTHPDYMFFFDLEEPALTWKGKVDVNNKQIVDGSVLGLKKRFFFFPYSENMATFRAKVLLAGEKVPFVKIPYPRFDVPEDFEDPGDMEKYPEIFSPEFVDWWFSVEDAMARGETPPPRPKAFFVPNAEENQEQNRNDADKIYRSKKRAASKKLGFDK